MAMSSLMAVSIDNHAAHEVGVVVALVIDDGKDLRLKLQSVGQCQ